MSEVIEAVFDGEVFHPEKPVKLEPNTRVRMTVEPSTVDKGKSSFLNTAKSLKLDGPEDWSEKLDEYLYEGKPLNEG